MRILICGNKGQSTQISEMLPLLLDPPPSPPLFGPPGQFHLHLTRSWVLDKFLQSKQDLTSVPIKENGIYATSSEKQKKKKLTWRLERSSNNKSFILSYLLTPENQKTQSHKGTVYIRPSYFILLCAFALAVACKNKGKLLVLLPF